MKNEEGLVPVDGQLQALNLRQRNLTLNQNLFFMERKFDLEERLIDFAAVIIDVSEALPRTRAGGHIGDQLLRSGTSPALHYGEAQAAESPADFIHKMKVCLKELRETFNCLRLINKKNWIKEGLAAVLKESNELVAIFVTSVATAQRNNSQSSKSKRN